MLFHRGRQPDPKQLSQPRHESKRYRRQSDVPVSAQPGAESEGKMVQLLWKGDRQPVMTLDTHVHGPATSLWGLPQGNPLSTHRLARC